MSTAIRSITRVQDADDVSIPALTDGYALAWDNATQRWVQASTLRGIGHDLTATETGVASSIYRQTRQTYTLSPSGDASTRQYRGQDITLATASGITKTIAGIVGQNIAVTAGSGVTTTTMLDGIIINTTNSGVASAVKGIWSAANNYNNISAGFAYGIESYVHNWSLVSQTGSIQTARAGRFRIQNAALATGSGAANIVTAQQIYGNLYNEGCSTVAATITTAVGFRYDITNAAYGTITNSYGVYLSTPSNAGTIGSHYGIYLETQVVAGTTNNYAIYSAGGQHFFAGVAGFGTGASTPAAQVDVRQGSATGAVPVLRLGQLDVDKPFLKVAGTSAADASQSLVDAADRPTPGALVGWWMVEVEDSAVSGAIPAGAYFSPLYAAPTA